MRVVFVDALAIAAACALALSCSRPDEKTPAAGIEDSTGGGDADRAAIRAEFEEWWASDVKREPTRGMLEMPSWFVEAARYDADMMSKLDSLPGPSAATIRRVGEDELSDSRGEVENYLRRELLELVWDEKTLQTLRDVLNRPWDKAGVQTLGDMALRRRSKEYRDDFPWDAERRILSLLAHVAAKRDEEDEVTGEIENQFDRVFREALPFPWGTLQGTNPWVWATMAIEDYGSERLLTPTFWEGYEDGRCAYRALVAVGDEKTLARLKEYEKHPPVSRRTILRRTILVIEAQREFPELKEIKDMFRRRERAKELMRKKRRATRSRE